MIVQVHICIHNKLIFFAQPHSCQGSCQQNSLRATGQASQGVTSASGHQASGGTGQETQKGRNLPVAAALPGQAALTAPLRPTAELRAAPARCGSHPRTPCLLRPARRKAASATTLTEEKLSFKSSSNCFQF